jgi:hypothetical protein
VNFADDGVSTDANFGGDLTASQSGDDAAFQLLDPLWGPGFDTHGNGLAIAAAFRAADRAMAFAHNRQPRESKGPERKFPVCGRQGTFSEKICPFKTLERQSIQDEAMTLYAAITGPHPRLVMQARR